MPKIEILLIAVIIIVGSYFYIKQNSSYNSKEVSVKIIEKSKCFTRRSPTIKAVYNNNIYFIENVRDYACEELNIGECYVMLYDEEFNILYYEIRDNFMLFYILLFIVIILIYSNFK